MKKNEIYLGNCPICNRPMYKGSSVDKHHFIPLSRGGKSKDDIHKICHRKLHSVFSNKELELLYSTAEACIEHPDIKLFIKWVSKKDPEYYDSSKNTNNKKGKTKYA